MITNQNGVFDDVMSGNLRVSYLFKARLTPFWLILGGTGRARSESRDGRIRLVGRFRATGAACMCTSTLQHVLVLPDVS